MSRARPGGTIAVALLATALLLTACDSEGNPLIGPAIQYDDDDDGSSIYPTCDPAPGESRVVLCVDDESHDPMPDGGSYEIARRPQGAVTIIAPMWFGGLTGGRLIEDFEVLFVAEDGEELGAYRNGWYRLQCEPDGTVADHRLEVFFDAIPDVSVWQGTTGTLTVRATTEDGDEIFDEVTAVLESGGDWR
jgi:hypothetical protein